jgi:hypothetical protein
MYACQTTLVLNNSFAMDADLQHAASCFKTLVFDDVAARWF